MSFRSKTRIAAFALSAAVLAACGGSGGAVNLGTVQDTTAPQLSFSPTTLTVASGGTGTSTFSATDNIAIRTGPTISCTQGGTFTDSTFTAPSVSAETISVCTATATDPSGNTGTATLTVTISAPNQAPSARATANKSVIAEGQPFVLDASNSSDPEGQTLAYSWSQIEGPAVDLSGASGAVLTLDAPLQSEDATLTFEVTVTDGEDETRELVSIDVEALEILTLTGTAPPFSGNIYTSQIAGITAPLDGGFRTHWAATSFTTRSWTASQLFTEKMEPVGPQSTATIQPIAPQEAGRFRYAIQSGERTYYVHESEYRERGEALQRGFALRSERPEGDVDSYGTLIVAGPRAGVFPIWFTGSAYSNGRLVSAILSTGLDNQPRSIDSYIHSPDGSQIKTSIVEPTDPTNKSIGAPSVVQAGETSYFVSWSESTPESEISSIQGLRVTGDGTQSGDILTISDPQGRSGGNATTQLSDGNILIVWIDYQSYPIDRVLRLQGRVMRPDGSFETEVFTFLSTADTDEYILSLKATAMQDGNALITWSSRSDFGEDNTTEPYSEKIKSIAISSDGAAISSIFNIYDSLTDLGDLASPNIDDLEVAVSTENRALIGWNFRTVDIVENSFYSDFYPVGR